MADPAPIIDQIITNALTQAQSSANLTTQYTGDAIQAAQSIVNLSAPPPVFAPGVEEVTVDIPKNALGVNEALFNTTFQNIITTLESAFTNFFNTYFPNEESALNSACTAIIGMITSGGTFIPAAIENQIWERDRARILNDGQRELDESVSDWSARGFPLPPGMLMGAQKRIQDDISNKVAQSSRETAIKNIEIVIENIRFAIGEAVKLRAAALAAAAEYMRALAIGPQVAVQLAVASIDAQAKLISAASDYYRARVAVADLGLRASQATSANFATIEAKQGDVFAAEGRMRTDAAVAAANTMGNMAASALNALHSNASLASTSSS